MDRDDFAKLLMAEDRKIWQNPDDIIEQIPYLVGSVVADLGCGPGFFSIPLSRRIGNTGKLYAVDEDLLMLRHLKSNLEKAQDKSNMSEVEIVQADVTDVKLPEKIIDVGFFANILHDLSDKPKFFSEVKRVLKPSGRIVDIDWHKMNTDDMGPPPEIRLSENESRRVLRASGFRVVNALNPGPYHYGFVCKIDSTP